MNKDVKELLELTETLHEWVKELLDEDIYPLTRKGIKNRLSALRSRLAAVGYWIPCDEQNPPPADTPMLVWRQYANYMNSGVHYFFEPVWCVESYGEQGEPGDNFTHYMLIEEPS